MEQLTHGEIVAMFAIVVGLFVLYAVLRAFNGSSRSVKERRAINDMVVRAPKRPQPDDQETSAETATDGKHAARPPSTTEPEA